MRTPKRLTTAQKLRKLTADARIADFRGWCARNSLPDPLPEYQFASPRRWRFDWCWMAQKVALEVEGGIFVQGRHSRGAGMLADMEKYNRATVLGWRVVRTTPQTLKSRETLAMLTALLA